MTDYIGLAPVSDDRPTPPPTSPLHLLPPPYPIFSPLPPSLPTFLSHLLPPTHFLALSSPPIHPHLPTPSSPSPPPPLYLVFFLPSPLLPSILPSFTPPHFLFPPLFPLPSLPSSRLLFVPSFLPIVTSPFLSSSLFRTHPTRINTLVNIVKNATLANTQILRKMTAASITVIGGEKNKNKKRYM